MSARVQGSPLRQALISTTIFTIFAVATRLIWGAVDPEMRSWSLVAVAPWAGLYTYLQASGRLMTIANMLVALGIGGFLFWSAILISGRWPTTREDLPYIVAILAFPAVALGLGLFQRHRLRHTSGQLDR